MPLAVRNFRIERSSWSEMKEEGSKYFFSPSGKKVKIHSSKNLKGLFEVLLSFLNEKSQNVENRHERRLTLVQSGNIPRFPNS